MLFYFFRSILSRRAAWALLGVLPALAMPPKAASGSAKAKKKVEAALLAPAPACAGPAWPAPAWTGPA